MTSCKDDDNTNDTWQGDWSVSREPMYLDDVTNADFVSRYSEDKWAKLPANAQRGNAVLGALGRRTQTDVNGARVSSYLPQNGRITAQQSTGMYHEPVFFLRTMWLLDNKSYQQMFPLDH